MDALESGHGSLGICRAHLGNHFFRLYFIKKIQLTLTANHLYSNQYNKYPCCTIWHNFPHHKLLAGFIVCLLFSTPA